MIARLKPNRLTLFEVRDHRRKNAHFLTVDSEKNAKKNLKSNSHKGQISESAKKKLKNAINYLWVWSKKRTIREGKLYIPNFKASLITLTLPSKQVHSDQVIKRKALDYWLGEMRRIYGLKNYVWKAEFQKNGNIHFHIITDSYISLTTAYRIWNNAMKKMGYTQKYTNKFSKMNWWQYHKYVNRKKNVPKEITKRRFQKGKTNEWKTPHMIDIKSIRSRKQMINYLAKYITKKNKCSTRATEMGRIWFLSRSLSNIKDRVNIELAEVYNLVNDLKSGKIKSWEFSNEWVVSWYFDVLTLAKTRYSKLLEYIDEAMFRSGYQPAGVCPIYIKKDLEGFRSG